MGAKLTWVLSGLDVSEAMDVLRGRAIVVDVDIVDGIDRLRCPKYYLRACLHLCLKEVLTNGAREVQVGIIGG